MTKPQEKPPILQLAINDLALAEKVDIRGKQYTPVVRRCEVFRKHFGLAWSLVTEIMPSTAPHVCVKASIISPDGAVVATGLAEEDRTKGPINKTSALENCETGAIGRALANFGLHGGEYATAEEVSTAIAAQGPTRASDNWHGPLTITKLKEGMRDLAGHLADCTDLGMLTGLLETTKDIQEQCMRDLPDWWYGDDHHEGAQKTIDAKRKELEGIEQSAGY